MKPKTRSALQPFLLCLGLLVSLSLTACVPRANPNTRVLLFSADVWGGSPFTEGQKRRVFLEALSAKSVRRLIKAIPFELENQTSLENQAVTIRRFEAVYEVNAKQTPPLVKNNYRLMLELSDNPPERITLRNTMNGVTWSLRIADTAN